MRKLVIGDLGEETVLKLEQRAASKDRSVEAEAAAIIQLFLARAESRAKERAAAIRAKLANREHSDSALLLAQDRGR